jgi:hypothetical protein
MLMTINDDVYAGKKDVDVVQTMKSLIFSTRMFVQVNDDVDSDVMTIMNSTPLS